MIQRQSICVAASVAMMLGGCMFGDESDVATTSAVTNTVPGALATSGDASHIFAVQQISGAVLLKSIDASDGTLDVSLYNTTPIVALSRDANSMTGVWALMGDGYLRRYNSSLSLISSIAPMPATFGIRTLCDMDQATNGDIYVTTRQYYARRHYGQIFRWKASTSTWGYTTVPYYYYGLSCPMVDYDEVSGVVGVYLEQVNGHLEYQGLLLTYGNTSLGLLSTTGIESDGLDAVNDVSLANDVLIVYGVVRNDAVYYPVLKMYDANGGTVYDSFGGWEPGLEFDYWNSVSHQAVTVGIHDSGWAAYVTGNADPSKGNVVIKVVDLLED